MSNSALSPGTEVRSPQRTYTIQRVLGQGGFGITYLVETQLKMGKISFSAKFALKEHFIQMMCEREATTNRVRFVQSAAKEVQASMRAFISEAQRLQRFGIDHRNIVNVDEVFEANGTAYYVMEYLDGGSLANYVKTHGGRLSWSETKALMQPICDAVAMLHRNRVAHYDIKPQNIMVMNDKQGLRPVLIDFGLAKHYDGQGEATSSLAAGGYTPGYAPMEQYTGLRQFSPASDVYALAATVCFCLTGHAPAKADELNLDALCDELLTVGVDAAIANVLLQAMELRATDRPANAGALTAALFNGAPLQTVRKQRNTGGGGTITQVKTGAATTPETPATAPRKRWLVPAIAAAAVALAAIIFFATRGGADTDTPTPANDTVYVTSSDTIHHTTTETIRVEHPAQPDQPVQQHAVQQQPQKQETSSPNSNRQQQTPQPAQQPATQQPAQQPAQQQPVQQPVAQQPSTANYRTTPRNLDLQVILNGTKYYFSQSEWANLSSSEQSRFTKRGVVIDYRSQSFVVNLKIERHGIGFRWSDELDFTWDEAKEWVRTKMASGWRLPTQEEGAAMARQYSAVNSALEAFDGDRAIPSGQVHNLTNLRRGISFSSVAISTRTPCVTPIACVPFGRYNPFFHFDSFSLRRTCAAPETKPK